MKKKWKDAWVAALRSGEYKKGRGALCVGGSRFCCLGVLTDLVNKSYKKPEEWEETNEKEPQGYRYEIFGTHEYLSNKVQKVTGLDSKDPYAESKERSLADLNDSGWSFKKIADLIEKEL